MDMVEKVAKAIFDTQDGTDGTEWEDAPRIWKPPYRVMARAALSVTASAIAERWGSEHPGALAIRTELQSETPVG